MNIFGLLFGAVLICLIISPAYSLSDNNMNNNQITYSPDLAIISGKKFSLSVNDYYYDIYYGIVLGESSDQDYDGMITSMSIIPEKKSLLITFDNIQQTDNAWIRFPNEVISAKNEKFSLFVDGIEKGYELSSHGNETRLGFVVPKDTQYVEIVGNNVIPEFSTNVLLVFLMVFSVIILLTRNHIKIKIP